MSLEAPRGTVSCEQMDVESVDRYFFDAALNNRRSEIEWARRICLGCSALTACREYALSENPPHGVFAAMTPKERTRIIESGEVVS